MLLASRIDFFQAQSDRFWVSVSTRASGRRRSAMMRHDQYRFLAVPFRQGAGAKSAGCNSGLSFQVRSLSRHHNDQDVSSQADVQQKSASEPALARILRLQ